MNDSIEPSYVSREEYKKQRDKGILQKQPEGKKSTLFIPEDLKLWEMVDVIEEVDSDTFAHDPSKRKDKRQELRDLGESFINAGIYVAQNLDQVGQGKKEAEETAKEFYRYGNKLQDGRYNEEVTVEDIAVNSLSPKQTEDIDKWFGVDKLAIFKQQEPEQTRKEMLKQFFKVTEQAKGSEPHRKGIEKAYKKHLEEPINRPERELQDVVFRRGMEKVLNEMGKDGWKDVVVENFKDIGIDLKGQEKNLREVLEIPQLQKELASVRKAGDLAKIGDKEREIALKIQEGVTRFPYALVDEKTDSEGSFPSKIVEKQSIICLGATLVGGALLRDVGLNYLVAGAENHSFTFLITSDEKVFRQDFTPRHPDSSISIQESNVEILDRRILPVKRGEKQVTTKDIVEYSHSSETKGLIVGMNLPDSSLVVLSRPEFGEQNQVLSNFGAFISSRGQKELAAEFYTRAIAMDDNDFHTYTNLGMLYMALGRKEESVDAFQKAAALDSQDFFIQQDLGMLLSDLGRKEEAVSAFQKAVALDPEDSFIQNRLGKCLAELGRKDEAIEVFRKVAELARAEGEDWLAQSAIEEMSRLAKSKPKPPSF